MPRPMDAPPTSARPVWAEVDLAALQANARAVRGLLKPSTDIMAVVKANAYGHGMERVAQALMTAGVEKFAVASLEEALRLRASGITGEILILGYSDPAASEELIAHSVIQTVGHPEHVRSLRDAARRVGVAARVHVKIDTGMTRLGAQEQRAQEVLYEAMAHPEVSCRGIYTHFHSADVPDSLATIHQWNALVRLLTPMKKVLGNIVIHAANTAAIINYPDTQADLVRPGIALYGAYPSPLVKRILPLKPVLSLKSKVVEVKTIGPGGGVGYNHRHVARSEESIAILPIGYADGYSTHLSGSGEVLIRGVRCRVEGQVSMDFTAVRVPEGTLATVGDEAVLLGKQGSDEITLEELAGWMGVVPYEPLSVLGPRVRRHYV